MSNMTIADRLMIAAVLLAPLIALQIQRSLSIARERRQVKHSIFQRLMATRAARVSAEHVQALNMIDLEFSGARFLWSKRQSSKEKAVIDAWKDYRDHLNNYPPPPIKNSDLKAWGVRSDELFTELLHIMSQALKYDFDKVHLKRGIYSPQAHGQWELDQQAIRQGIVKALSGEVPLSVSLVEAAPISESEPVTETEAEEGAESDS